MSISRRGGDGDEGDEVEFEDDVGSLLDVNLTMLSFPGASEYRCNA